MLIPANFAMKKGQQLFLEINASSEVVSPQKFFGRSQL